MCHSNMTPTPFYMCHFQIFDKIDSFQKNVNFLKKVNYIFEELLNLHIIVG